MTGGCTFDHFMRSIALAATLAGRLNSQRVLSQKLSVAFHCMYDVMKTFVECCVVVAS